MAMIAHMATLKARVPFLHFFDGFRTSHEVNKIELLLEDDARPLIDETWSGRTARARSTRTGRCCAAPRRTPTCSSRRARPATRSTSPCRASCSEAMERFATLTGRQYGLFEYAGAPDAERVIVLMGSGVGALREAVAKLVAAGEKVGLVTVRLYRPFDVEAFVAALPKTRAAIAVLDRTKEPGAIGEPLYQDVVTALAEGWPHAGAAARDRRPLRPVVEGVHAGDGEGRASTSWRRSRSGTSPSASSTTSRTCR